MPDLRAVVLLHQLGAPDVLSYRSLKFKSTSDHIDIGRASKRENKNLAPARDNALFDSRVMSRTHATISVSLEKKAVYICDPGSMHGTWINQTKIPVDENVEITNGDILTFGVEVIRGPDTFPPLAVRAECQWFETSDMEVQKSNQTTNTFCVPDDDDECEIIHNPIPMVSTLDQSSESNESAECSDSEDNHSVMIVSSAVTSPVKVDITKDAPIFYSGTNDGGTTGSEQNPIDLGGEQSEQPLATPRMTPPSPTDKPEDLDHDTQYYAEYFEPSEDEESIGESGIWETGDCIEDVDEQDEEEEDADSADESEASEAGPSNSETKAPNQVPDNLTLPLSVDVTAPVTERDPQNLSTHNTEVEGSVPDDSHLERATERDFSEQFSVPVLNASNTSEFDSHCAENSSSMNASCAEKPNQLPWPIAADKHNTTPSFPMQLNSKLFDHSLAAFTNPYTTVPPEQSGSACSYSKYAPYELIPFQDPSTAHATYNDGPFASNHAIMVANNTSTSKSIPDSNIPSIPFMDPLTPLLPRMQRTTSSCGGGPSSMHVDSRSLKRKAVEMEADSGREPPTTCYNLPSTESPSVSTKEGGQQPAEDSYMPDALPQIPVSISDCSNSQLTTVNLSKDESPKNALQHGPRPSKRAKTSNRTSFRNHAATAVLGAVVGAIGTIAALAALPADYFA